MTPDQEFARLVHRWERLEERAVKARINGWGWGRIKPIRDKQIVIVTRMRELRAQGGLSKEWAYWRMPRQS